MYRFQKDMKRVIKKCPITYFGVDGWEVLVRDVDVFKRGEEPCENCMYEDGVVCDCCAACFEVHGCERDLYTYFVFVEGYLSDKTGKEI